MSSAEPEREEGEHMLVNPARSPAETAFDRGVRSLQAHQLFHAHRYFSVAIRLEPQFDLAHELAAEVRVAAATHIQALFRGSVQRLHPLPFHLVQGIAFPIRPGHNRVRSPLNLQRYLFWLQREMDSQDPDRVAEARLVFSKLPVTHHAWHLDEPGPVISCFGPLPAVPCRRRPCQRCVGAGGFDLFGPFRTRALGGYHFRFLGPWSTANGNDPAVEA